MSLPQLLLFSVTLRPTARLGFASCMMRHIMLGQSLSPTCRFRARAFPSMPGSRLVWPCLAVVICVQPHHQASNGILPLRPVVWPHSSFRLLEQLRHSTRKSTSRLTHLYPSSRSRLVWSKTIARNLKVLRRAATLLVLYKQPFPRDEARSQQLQLYPTLHPAYFSKL